MHAAKKQEAVLWSFLPNWDVVLGHLWCIGAWYMGSNMLGSMLQLSATPVSFHTRARKVLVLAMMRTPAPGLCREQKDQDSGATTR